MSLSKFSWPLHLQKTKLLFKATKESSSKKSLKICIATLLLHVNGTIYLISYHFTNMPKTPRHPKGQKPILRNSKGEITTWIGSSDDANNLRHFVSSGQLDGLTPKQVREKHTDFKKYAYSTFAGALQNIRGTHNKTVADRANLNRKLL